MTSPQPELRSPAEQVCPGSEKPGRQAPPAQAFSALTAITPRQAGRRPGSEGLLRGLDLGGLPDGGRRARSPQTAGEAGRGGTKAVTVQGAHGAAPLPGRSDPHLTSMNSAPCSWDHRVTSTRSADPLELWHSRQPVSATLSLCQSPHTVLFQ